MRAHRLRPCFDSLDTRLVLDGGIGGAAVSTLAATAVVGSIPGGEPTPGHLVELLNWYQSGTPPTQPYTPLLPPIPWNLMPPL